MAKSFECILGTVRVYELRRPSRKTAGTQPRPMLRARLRRHGTLHDGPSSPTYRLAVEGLLDKLKVGPTKQKSILALIESPFPVGLQTAMSQPSIREKLVGASGKMAPRLLHVFCHGNSQSAALRHFGRPGDKKIRMVLFLPKVKLMIGPVLYVVAVRVASNSASNSTTVPKACDPSAMVQVNLFQKQSFLHQLTHNVTKDCSWNYYEQYVVILWVN